MQETAARHDKKFELISRMIYAEGSLWAATKWFRSVVRLETASHKLHFSGFLSKYSGEICSHEILVCIDHKIIFLPRYDSDIYCLDIDSMAVEKLDLKEGKTYLQRDRISSAIEVNGMIYAFSENDANTLKIDIRNKTVLSINSNINMDRDNAMFELEPQMINEKIYIPFYNDEKNALYELDVQTDQMEAIDPVEMKGKIIKADRYNNDFVFLDTNGSVGIYDIAQKLLTPISKYEATKEMFVLQDSLYLFQEKKGQIIRISLENPHDSYAVNHNLDREMNAFNFQHIVVGNKVFVAAEYQDDIWLAEYNASDAEMNFIKCDTDEYFEEINAPILIKNADSVINETDSAFSLKVFLEACIG